MSREHPAVSTPSAIVAGNLRRRREELGWSQETLAAGVRAWGFEGFTRGTVAQIENGRRRLSVDELVLFAFLLQTPISPSADVAGPTFPSPEQWFSLLTVDPSTTIRVGTKNGPVWILRVPSEHVVNTEVTDAQADEAMAKVARGLGISTDDVSEVAVQLWGHGIIDERERRLEAGGGGSGDTRTRRTHITRILIGELQRAMVEWFAGKARKAERQLAEMAPKRAKQAGQSTTRRSGR